MDLDYELGIIVIFTLKIIVLPTVLICCRCFLKAISEF